MVWVWVKYGKNAKEKKEMENSHLQKYSAAHLFASTAILADSYVRLLVVSTTTPVASGHRCNTLD